MKRREKINGRGGNPTRRPRRLSAGRIGLAFAVTLFLAGAATPAEAADMRHRLREHVIESYFIGSLGASVTERAGDTVPGLLTTQLGVGVMFPGAGCGGLGAWGFELAVGPVMPLNPDLVFDTQFSPSFLLELPISNLQLSMRGGAILQASQPENPGFALAFLAGWYARPMSFRVGLGYDAYADGRVFTGLRFEVLWLGIDPIPGY